MVKLKRESAREQIREHLLKGIYDGTFPPGYRFREKELAETFGTSQAPVREALRELEGLQCVVTYPYKGTLVREVTSKDIAVAYRLRGLLEQVAVELICENGPRDWSELRQIAEEADIEAKRGDKEEYSKYNVSFHNYIITACGDKMIKHMWNLISFPMQVQKALEITHISLLELSSQHMSIIAELEKCDGERAGALILEHANAINELIKEEVN